MTTDTTLTNDLIESTIEDIAWPNDEVMQFAKELSRAIAQAVLQLPEIQALRKDAVRYRRLRQGSIKDVAVVRGLDAMDYGSSGVAPTYSEEIDGDDLDAAIDAAMEQQA